MLQIKDERMRMFIKTVAVMLRCLILLNSNTVQNSSKIHSRSSVLRMVFEVMDLSVQHHHRLEEFLSVHASWINCIG